MIEYEEATGLTLADAVAWLEKNGWRRDNPSDRTLGWAKGKEWICDTTVPDLLHDLWQIYAEAFEAAQPQAEKFKAGLQ